MRRRGRDVVALLVVVATSACSSGNANDETARSSTTVRPTEHSKPAPARASLSGTARLDGSAFDAQFIGAVVLDHGLVTPCNVSIPAIVGGRFALDVFGDDELAGCGRRGAQVVLWTYADGRKLFSRQAIDWPVRGHATVAVDFSPSEPSGAAPTLLELNGEVHRPNGQRVAAGARVEAFIGTTLCGIASVRSGVFDGYILHVVSQDSIAGCRTGATITFRVDGKPVIETHVNRGPPPRRFDLTLQ